MLVIRIHLFLCKIGARHIRNIIAAIARLRPAWVVRRNAPAAQLHRDRQIIDLRARIVIVKLARHIPARRMQHIA